ncbi:metallophosphoesterase [Candidatus Woesearchaeota archaeon]|nr:metallophosphoesterase [Candidatus Woesearchaeota archaeon]
MKFLIVGDLHGNKPNVYYRDFNAVIAPGDFGSDAPRTYMFESLKQQLQDPKSKIQWYDIVGKKKAREMVQKSISDGRSILEQLNSIGVPVYTVPGNWDWVPDKGSKWPLLKKDHFKGMLNGLENIVNVYHRIVDIGDYQIIGHGITTGPEYPQYKEDLQRLKPVKLKKVKVEYEKLHKKVSLLFEKATKPVIFLSHNVPFNTPIDEITNKESPRYGYHYGSLIARELIDRYDPLICIGGHMHEHFGKCKIGKTVAINAGFGSNVNTWLELEGDKIKKLEFYKGK